MPKPKGHQAVERIAARLQHLTVEDVRVTLLRPNTYNPNRQSDHEFYLLVLSMAEDGFTQPIIVHRATQEIVDGEHRWTAAIVLHYLQKIGLPMEMTPEQMRVATLRHNRARGTEDITLTAQVLRELQELGALDLATDSLLMDDVEINRMLKDVPAPDALAGVEFGAAWQPGHADTVDVHEREEATGEVSAHAASLHAVETGRRLEERLKAATSEEERVQARQEASIYRLSLVFAGQEAALVRQVLGKTPAETLLNLCREATGVQQDLQPA